MKLRLSSSFVKQSLSSHSWIGLMVSAMMYLVCLSGALAVFYQEFERWEQPEADEFLHYDPQILDRAYGEVLASDTKLTHHMFVQMPTVAMPRMSIASEDGGWLVNADGSLGQPVRDGWTSMLLFLHIYLHLPESVGLVVVGALGAMLCALIVSGFFAHPRIFKDAFSLRLRGSRRLEQVDLHNRLSVWGAPFHLMIAVTGAYFGLAVLISAVLAQVFYDGDSEALLADMYGNELELQQDPAPPALATAVQHVEAMAPGTTPIFITLENANEAEHQYLVVGSQHPDRLIYAEQYRFDAAGNYIDKLGYSDGETGRQVIYSTYRIHFGHFGGFPVKLLFGLLGLALTVVSVTGVNIWLARRKTRDYINNLWTGCVWGTPMALGFSAIGQILAGLPPTLPFWLVLVGAMSLSQVLDHDARSKLWLNLTTAAVLAVLVATHIATFGADALTGAALGINAALVAGALLFAGMAYYLRRPLDNDSPPACDSLPA